MSPTTPRRPSLKLHNGRSCSNAASLASSKPFDASRISKPNSNITGTTLDNDLRSPISNHPAPPNIAKLPQMDQIDRPTTASDKPSMDNNKQSSHEESESARLERLGRQRPAQFKTIWSEVAFAYSILASQMMAVRSLPFTPFSSPDTLTPPLQIGILRIRLQRHPAHSQERAPYPTSFSSLARLRLLTRHRRFPVTVRPSRRHVRRLRRLSVRPHLVHAVVANRRFQPK